jgi:1-deoxy-D-xylulose-5-phosphate reductoisomerase
LGSTGSIGTNTLDVVSRHPERFRIFALTASSQVEAMLAQCRAFAPRYAVMSRPDAAHDLAQRVKAEGLAVEVLSGEQALCEVSAHAEAQVVMAAIVGAAGLAPSLAAARAGKRLLLANKEAIVVGGSMFMQAVREGGGVLLPIDSEHSAVFQSLPEDPSTWSARVSKIILTASGGPFRTRDPKTMPQVTPQEACAHPNWSMGRKISVDSATMMNKGLELIEAHFLFDIAPERLDVVIHPQSIIHSMVQYIDGSLLAQLGHPDMRTPIAHALGWPERIESGVSMLDLATHGRLDFERPDPERFPCLRLAREALSAGAAAPCVLNAANEIAVDAFLERRIRFTDIARVNEQVLDALGASSAPTDTEAVLSLDRRARERARACLLECAA